MKVLFISLKFRIKFFKHHTLAMELIRSPNLDACPAEDIRFLKQMSRLLLEIFQTNRRIIFFVRVFLTATTLLDKNIVRGVKAISSSMLTI